MMKELGAFTLGLVLMGVIVVATVGLTIASFRIGDYYLTAWGF